MAAARRGARRARRKASPRMGSLPCLSPRRSVAVERPGAARFPAAGSPGPGLRRRAALFGRWLCEICGHGGSCGSPPPSPAPSRPSRAQNGRGDCNPGGVRVYCVWREEGNLPLRRLRLPGAGPGSPSPASEGASQFLALPSPAKGTWAGAKRLPWSHGGDGVVANLMIRFAVGAGGLDNRVYPRGAPNQLLVIGLSFDWRPERGEARPDNSEVLYFLSPFSVFLPLLTFIKPFYDLLFCTLPTTRVWDLLSPPHKMFYSAQE